MTSTKKEQPVCWRCNNSRRVWHGASETWAPCFECVPPGEWAAASEAAKPMPQPTRERLLQRMVRRIPVDFRAVAEEAGMTRGKLCHSPAFGWIVQNTSENPAWPNIAKVTPPPMLPGETRLAVEEGHWCFYAPNKEDGPH